MRPLLGSMVTAYGSQKVASAPRASLYPARLQPASVFTPTKLGKPSASSANLGFEPASARDGRPASSAGVASSAITRVSRRTRRLSASATMSEPAGPMVRPDGPRKQAFSHAPSTNPALP